jgi:hypothetical protein
MIVGIASPIPAAHADRHAATDLTLLGTGKARQIASPAVLGLPRRVVERPGPREKRRCSGYIGSHRENVDYALCAAKQSGECGRTD